MSVMQLHGKLLVASLLFCLPACFAGNNDASITASAKAAQQAYLAQNLPLAEQKYLEALQTAGKGATLTRFMLLKNLGCVYRDEHNYPEAEKTFAEALSMSTAVSAPAPALATLCRQYSVLMRKMHREDEANKMEARAELALHPVSSNLSNSNANSNANSISNAVNDGEADIIVGSSTGALFDSGVDSRANVESVAGLKGKISADPSDVNLWYKLGNAYSKAGDYDNAIAAYGHVVSRSELRKEIHRKLCYCYLRKGWYRQSADECKSAYDADSNNATLCALACNLYLRAGDTAQFTSLRRELVSRFPTNVEALRVSTLGIKLVRAADPYFSASTLAATGAPVVKDPWERKWQKAFMPLRVYIAEAPTDTTMLRGSSPELPESSSSDLIMRAFNEWAQASGGLTQFTYVSDPSQADIRCNWTSNPSALHAELAVGLTTQATGAGGRPTGYIVQLLAIDKTTGKILTKERFFEVTLHEVGHALGLGHSKFYGDIMYPTVHDQAQIVLSQNDRDRIMKLYSSQ